MKLYFFIPIIVASATGIWSAGCAGEQKHTAVQPLTAADSLSFLTRGDSITGVATTTLLAKVAAAMQEGGPANAVDYCSARALPLIDSLALAYDCSIRRATDRNRNPADTLLAREQNVWDDYTAQKAGQAPMKSRIVVAGDTVYYYRPIAIGMPACLQCHGQPDTDINTATLAALKTKYPEDRATGYRMGDLRGMWSLGFRR
jgi:hypothetical protein